MAKKKRVWKSLLGLPFYLLIGIALFLAMNTIYDWWVGDRNMVRYGVLIGSTLIIIISIIAHLIPLKTVVRIAKRQMGGN